MTPDFGLFCNPESRRVEGFSIALGRTLRQRPAIVPWSWVLENFRWQQRFDNPPRFLRLESPGRNWGVERQLLLRGAAIKDEEEGRGWGRLSSQEVAALPNDAGRVLPMRQWFLGWRDVLRELHSWAESVGLASHWMCLPQDVECMFDKAACQEKLHKAGFAVP